VSTEDNLFAASAAEQMAKRAPLAVRLRPRNLDEVVGQTHLLSPGKPLRALIDADRLTSIILWGPPGTGKTSIARVVAASTSKAFEELSATSAKVSDVRSLISAAEARLGERNQSTILFLDEVHRFNKAQQDALLPVVESGLLTLIGATTENPFYEVNAPLLSRSALFRLEPLDDSECATLLRRGLEMESYEADDDAIEHLVADAGGDARHALTTLEVAAIMATEDGLSRVSLQHALAASGTKALRYGRDEHYDIASAFIKAIRGSDVDATLYWLARMLEAGDDAKFIARRLVISASEDIGLADSNALLVADAAARAVEFVGLPEARINLAHAAVYLATAAKSNSAYVALGAAQQSVQRPGAGQVPVHLRDASHSGARKIGHGEGYLYPHDYADGFIEQDYRPAEVTNEVYYHPSNNGAEGPRAEAWQGRRRPKPDETASGN
jgi:putative ATPase